MWRGSLKNWKSIALLLLIPISAASLTGCASWLEELQAEQAAKKVAALPPNSAPRLPNLPAELRTCLLKQSCQEAATKASQEGAPKPQCTTADGIVIAYVQTEREKLACASRLMSWWKQQQKIQKDALDVTKHPRSTPKAGWP